MDKLESQFAKVIAPRGWQSHRCLFMRGIACFFFLFPGLPTAHAQSSCYLPGIKHSGILSYPPIARQAHVQSEIRLLVHFATDGSVQSTEVESGYGMFRDEAINWVKSWQVYASPEPQTCNVEIDFRVEGEGSCDYDPTGTVRMIDPKHFVVTTKPVLLCDPSAAMTTTRHRFLFFRWHSKQTKENGQ